MLSRSSVFLYSQERLGRIPQWDPRNKKHLVALHPAKQAAAKDVNIKFWVQPFIRDQGETPQCVAYSTNGYVEAGPVRNNPFKTIENFYKEVQANDEWAPEPHDGTSVLASFQTLKKHGIVDSYDWAYDVETCVDFIATTGPVVFGTSWYNNMFNVVQGDIVTVVGSSGLAGGHAYLGMGINRLKKMPDGSTGAIRCVNSWGESWAMKGRFWISFQDMDRLIHESGEAAVSKEIVHQGEEPW